MVLIDFLEAALPQNLQYVKYAISTKHDKAKCSKMKYAYKTTQRPSNPSSRHLPKGIEIKTLRSYLHPHIHCSSIHNSQHMDATSTSTDGYIKKIQCTHTMDYYSAIKKEENPAICKNRDEPGG